MPSTADLAHEPSAPAFVRGERVLVEAIVAEAYPDDICVRIVTGTNGFIQSIWVRRVLTKKLDGEATIDGLFKNAALPG